MADTNNGGKQPNSGGPQEPSIEKRLLLAFVLMGAVLFLAPYLYRTFNPPPPRPAPVAHQAPQPTPEEPAAKPPAEATPVASAAKPPATPVAGKQPEIRTIETGLFRVVFSNQGAVARSWSLKQFKDNAGQPLDLVSPAGSEKTGYPFALAIPRNDKLAENLNHALYAVKTPDPLTIEFEYSDGTSLARKVFKFHTDSYIAEVSTSVTSDGQEIAHLVAWRGGFGDPAVQSRAGSQSAVYFDPVADKLILKHAGDAKNGALTESGNFTFAGVQDNYFAAVLLPQNGSPVQFRVVSDSVPAVPNGKEEPHVGVAAGGAGENRFELFVGPKDYDLLKSVDPRLAKLVDFGKWFGWLAKPLFVILNWLNDSFVHNYGWAIVVVTIFINTALLPLKLSSMRSMKRMQALKPQIDAINARYKNIGLRDPRKAEQNQEVMALYKKHGINPMGGCLPMVLQIPVFIGFYNVLTIAIEMRGASWLWVHDLSQPEQLPIRILPIAMIVAQFVQQKMTPNPTADPNQQRMMMFMPLVFGFMFYGVSSGLVLYWLTSNLVGIVQQYFINKSMPAAAPVAAPQPAARPRKTSGSRR